MLGSVKRIAVSVFLLAGTAFAYSPAQANGTFINICNQAHSDTLYFIAAGRSSEAHSFSGEGWHAAQPGTCKQTRRFRGSPQIAFAFAVLNNDGVLIPVKARTSTSLLKGRGRFDDICGYRDHQKFGGNPSESTCIQSRMPVPVSFVLIPEERFSGGDKRFNVPVYSVDGPYDLAALPPDAPAPEAPQYDPTNEVSMTVCNQTFEQVRASLKTLDDAGPYRIMPPTRVGPRSCISMSGDVAEGREIELHVEVKPRGANVFQSITKVQYDTFLPGQIAQRDDGSRFSVFAKARDGNYNRITVVGDPNEELELIGEY